MTIWIIEPRDPLIVRDGRPFGPNPGARAATLPFPMPSTIVGGLRHKAGLDGEGAFDRAAIADVLNLTLCGPLLVELHADCEGVKQCLFPAPADALILEADAQLRVLRLAPRTLPGSPITSLPDGLQPIAPAVRLPNKVSNKAPHFWHQVVFERWLKAPADDAFVSVDKLSDELGIGALERSVRTHVSVLPETQTAREGALFQTRGLEFVWRDHEAARRDNQFQTRRLALVAALERERQSYAPANFTGGLAPLGGERRLMRWFIVDAELPKPPSGLFEQIISERRARVILLTPAIFAAGYRPALSWVRGGEIANLKAAAVPRPQVVSGWDMNADNGPGRPRGKPKATRRLAPAGAVYFVEWPAGADIGAWLEATWMQNVSDAEQDQRDGFGLAAIGVWPASDKEQQS